jgi:hypothetical protein
MYNTVKIYFGPQNVPVIISFLRYTKQHNNLNYMSFKIVPLHNCKFLPATVKMLETFLEIILWNPFQLFCSIVNVASSITKAPSLQC